MRSPRHLSVQPHPACHGCCLHFPGLSGLLGHDLTSLTGLSLLCAAVPSAAHPPAWTPPRSAGLGSISTLCELVGVQSCTATSREPSTVRFRQQKGPPVLVRALAGFLFLDARPFFPLYLTFRVAVSLLYLQSGHFSSASRGGAAGHTQMRAHSPWHLLTRSGVWFP